MLYEFRSAGIKSVLYACLLVHPVAMATPQPDPLPSPLTLEQALALADQSHPDRELANARLLQAQAERIEVGAENDLRLDFIASLGVVEPSPIALDQSNNDSWAKLRLQKRLYDFGHSSRIYAAADARQEGREWQLLEVRQQRRLEVMARFFDVLLADLQYARDNEAMSIAFVRFDRAQNRSELGQISDIDLLELESRFQQLRLKMLASQNRQRTSRSLLALSLNRPNDLPAELVYPSSDTTPVQGDLETWIQRALNNNPDLMSLRAEVKSAEQQLQLTDPEDHPVIRGELEAANYNRTLGGRNPLSASLIFEMPLYAGKRRDADRALQRARLQEKRALLSASELNLRQQLLEIWLDLQQLETRQDELAVTGDYRDLYLERNRSLYDLERATDLGDSMVQIADLNLQKAENDFQIRLLQARLAALAGTLVPADQSELANKE